MNKGFGRGKKIVLLGMWLIFGPTVLFTAIGVFILVGWLTTVAMTGSVQLVESPPPGSCRGNKSFECAYTGLYGAAIGHGCGRLGRDDSELYHLTTIPISCVILLFKVTKSQLGESVVVEDIQSPNRE